MKIAIIGAGFGGLSSSAYLAKAGHEVHVFEKNEAPGGRASVIEKDGFTFDVGPSWYLMPDVFDEFFADFGHKTSDFYELTQLIPGYRLYFEDEELDIRPQPAAYKDFEEIEIGAGPKLAKHLKKTKREYEQVRKHILTIDGLSKTEFVTTAALRFGANPALLGSFHKRISGVVKDERLQKALEFMVVFMGGSPDNIPALYGLLNWVDLGGGVWYPHGGFGAVARAFESVVRERGVNIHYNCEVTSITQHHDGQLALKVDGKSQVFDKVVANADYQYVETQLLQKKHRAYDSAYWQDKTLSPSAVIGLIGVKGRLALEHHSLFFDTDWHQNFADVFDQQQINEKPLFYLCTPSVSDPTVAPTKHENLFILIPVANKAVIDDTRATMLVDGALARIAAKIGEDLTPAIVSKTVLGPDYFKQRYNASLGNAFGLAHTGSQSGPLRPKIRSDKVKGLYYVGQFTNPGTGVPLVVLGGKVVAERLLGDVRRG